jgi:hypothetical protein
VNGATRLAAFGFEVRNRVAVKDRLRNGNGVATNRSGARSAGIARGRRNALCLAAVVAAWPALPEAIRAGIVAMVKAASTG